MVVIVYLVAGMSSRFGGKAKQMAKVGPNNETLIQYSVDQALNNPFNKLIFITNSITEHLFKNIFGNYYKNIPVLYILQKYENNRSKPWGTTDAICCIYNIVNEPFILVNGDDIYGIDTFTTGFNLINNSNKNIIGCTKLYKTLPENNNIVNRGIIYTKNNYVYKMKEVLKINKFNSPELLNEFANVNFIGLQPNILKLLYIKLNNFKNINKNNNSIECLLPDMLNELIEENKLLLEYFEITFNIIGITYPEDELFVKQILNKYN